jgi:subtilisin family serine protease
VDGGFPENDFLDRLGHGTAVMAAIQEKAPRAEYFAVRVFDRELRTNIDALIAGIKWSIENRMDVVNLSLGTSNPGHASKFAAPVSRVIVVSAAGMFPGDLPGVIRVGLDASCPRNQFRVNGDTFYASGFPRSIEGVPVERNLNGISFAVANMTGFVARVCEGLAERSFESVCARLHQQAS